jgi:predicted ATPase
VEGEVFHRGAVQALGSDETQLTPSLAALVRKRLISTDRSLIAGDDAFRFRHLLLRDAAYDALSKAARAELHERLAAWLDERGGALVELDELVGYHLEQAAQYRVALRRPADEVASAAKSRLMAAGLRAALRQDYRAAARLLERAAALAPADDIDLALEIELSEALLWMGRHDEALERAEALVLRAATAVIA